MFNRNTVSIAPVNPRVASQLVEIPVPASANGTTQIGIPDQPFLRSQVDKTILIRQMQLITNDVLTNGIAQQGANAPITELQKMVLVLYSEQWEKGLNIPLCSMINTFVEGSGIPYNPLPFLLDDWQDVDWTKSRIQLANGTVVAGAPYVIIFDVQYFWPEKPIRPLPNY